MNKRYTFAFGKYDAHEGVPLSWESLEFDTLEDALKEFENMVNKYYKSNWEYDETTDHFFRADVYDKETHDYIVDSLDNKYFYDETICCHIKEIFYGTNTY